MISFIRFHQPVGLPDQYNRNEDMTTSVNNSLHDLEIDGVVIKITRRSSGVSTYTSLFNVSYWKELPDAVADTPTKGSGKASGRQKKEQDKLV